MHVIRTESDFQALEDADLLALIHQRITEALEYVNDFGDLVFFVVVQPGDDIADVDAALGFPVMANRFDGTAFGELGFAPSWDVLEEHAGHYLLTYVLADDGQGVTLFVPRTGCVSPTLLAMCRQFTPLEADT